MLLALIVDVARGEGKYQSTKDGRTLVWNGDSKSGDLATWSGARDRNDYAHGFGRLIWYTTEPGFDKPQLYARYWGRMVGGKLEGPVNVHSKRKTHYAIFIDGVRVTSWSPGTAPSRATARWSALVAKRNRSNIRSEPESPAAGPAAEMPQVTSHRSLTDESIQDFYTDRRPKIDIDDSLRLLAFPPRTLRR
jgi:hypothetical protein